MSTCSSVIGISQISALVKILFAKNLLSLSPTGILLFGKEEPTEAKKALNMILNAQVSKVGCQVDMAQYRYEEYCFVFGKETFTFGFLPHSYFCYDAQDYELEESRLTALRDSLHEMAAETENAQ